MTHFELIRPQNLLIIGNTGVQTAPEATCEHGQPAVLLALFGTRRSSPGQQQRVDALMPRCILAQFVGSLQSQILRTEGEDALQQFRDEITTATTAAAAAYDQLHEQRRDCCEAGFRTNGAEHTCGRRGDGDRE